MTPPHVPDRIESAGEGAAPEGLAISRELLSAVAGRIAGACFIPPFDRCGIMSETLGCLSLPGPPHRRVGVRPRGPVCWQGDSSGAHEHLTGTATRYTEDSPVPGGIRCE